MNSVLITGANRGIGKALTQEFLQYGWRVFAGTRKLEDIVETLPSLVKIPLDVTSDEQVFTAVETVRKMTGGELQILVNNAAVFPDKENHGLTEMDLNGFREAFETNVIGVARMIQRFRPLLISGSRIVNISSGLGSISDKNDCDYYAYSVSKAALNMLTRTVAAEFAPEGVAVVAISPGWVRSDMGGSKAPLSPEESAQSIFRTITQLSMQQTGTFLSRSGSSTEYQW